MRRGILAVILGCLLFVGQSVTAIEEAEIEQGNIDTEIEQAIQEREDASELYDTPIFLEEESSIDLQQSQLINQTKEHSKFYNSFVQNVKEVYALQIENTNAVSALLAKPLTWDIEKGPVEKLHLWGTLGTNMDANFPQGDDSTVDYNVHNINVLLDGKLRSGKEDFSLMLDITPMHKTFFKAFIQDAYIQTHRMPHHSLLVGNSRPYVGYEGAQSPYTLPLMTRSQISRHFGAVRKAGVRLKGNYTYASYDLGAYSSDTFFTEFMPGTEFDGWINFKPLAKLDKRYGELIAGGGLVSGDRNNKDFLVSGAVLGYEYKRIWFRSEYAISDGSNGATGFNDRKREGWYATLGYHLTPRVELVARYDEFDNDRNIKNNNRREYTAGMNYYVKGQALKLILNYIYAQTQNQLDSHKLLLGTQLIL